jgi:hypothetical protein
VHDDNLIQVTWTVLVLFLHARATLMASTPIHLRSSRVLLTLALGAGLLAVPALGTAARATSAAAPPDLAVRRIIETTPFRGSSRSMHDNEGSSYVAREKALWLVDDEGQRIFVVDVRSGKLKRTIGPKALAAVRRFDGRARAGIERSRDLESVAYDAARDRLYVFSGNDCWPSSVNCQVAARPTAFRLDRRKGRLRLHSYQPLVSDRNNNAAAWNPRSRRTFVGNSEEIRRYNYVKNRFGPPIQIAGVTGLLGMDFTADGRALLVTHQDTALSHVDWTTRSLSGGWTVDLAPLQVSDARGVAVISDRFFVSDGADDRARSSRYRYAVFVLGAG